MAKLSWLLAGACMALSTWAAPAPRFTVDVWGPDEGLPQGSVIALTQTRDGYLWLGTLNGLVRFDGVQFKVYDENNTPGLNSSRIVSLHEDQQGNLWVGTETAGAALVKEGKVISLDIGRGSREGRLAAVAEDGRGAVWLYTANGQLGRYRDGQVDLWNAGSDRPSRTRALIADNSGLLWVGTDWSLAALGPVPADRSAALVVAYELAVPRLDFLLASRQGGYWRLANGRIQKCLRDQVERTFGQYPWKTWTTPVNAACEDPRGNLVVGTGGEGVFWFDATGSFVQLTSTNSGLSQNTVLSLCFDREGDLWVGTDGGGLNRVRSKVFEVVESSRDGTVQSVSEDNKGGLWIGYNGERVDYLGSAGAQSYTNRHGLNHLNVKSILVDRAQEVWAGTYGGGLLRFQNGVFRPTAGLEAIPRNREISALYEDREGRLWAGSQAGLACREAGQWRIYSTRDGLSADVVRALVEDAQGNLWIGTEGGGLNCWRSNRFSWFGKTNSLPSNNVTSLLVDEGGGLWVGTASGLAFFQHGQGRTFADQEELSGGVAWLLDDQRGYLWIGSYTGLKRVSWKELKDYLEGRSHFVAVRSYGRPEGLPTRECTQGSQPAAVRAADGRLWFPTIKGLASVNPALLARNTNPPPVVIEAVRVDGELQGTNTLRARPPEAVTVPAGRESLEIEFTSLNLSAPEKGRFRYRLDSHESRWREVPSSVRSVRYTKLPPGRYRFQVTAANEDAVWNLVPATLAVEVLPPFWRTWWFITVVTLGLVALIAGSVHYVSTQRLQRQLAALRQKEALEKERARIARDLHDQLGANLTQVALLGELAESDKDLPHEIEGHARQISQTARETTRALDEIVWTVNPSNDTLEGLINYICKYAQEYLALAGLRYRLEVPPQLPPAPISPELRHNVFLAAKEAVNNIVKHANATSAWVRLSVENGQFVLEVEDNGRGLPPGDARKDRNGLRNMRKRMQDVGGGFEIGPGAEGGTRIRLNAPLGKPGPGPAPA